MAVSRYVTLRAIKHSGNDFAANTPIALSDEYAAPLLAIGAIQAQAGPLPTMPTVPGAVVREAVDTGSGGKARTYVEAVFSDQGIRKKVGDRIISPDRMPLPGPRMRDLSTVFGGVTVAITSSVANSAAAGYTVSYGLDKAKPLGCALGNVSAAGMQACLVADTKAALVGIETIVIGTKLSVRWHARINGTAHYWLFVDDKPATADPVAYNTASAYQFQSLDITLPDSGPHIVTLYASNVGGWDGLACDSTGALIASDRQARKFAITGDSFVPGSAMNSNAFTTFAGLLAVRYGYDVLNNGYGGTGYINDGGAGILMPFGHPTRVNNVKQFQPDEHLFFGSVNDNGYNGVGVADAVTSTIQAYRAACDCKTTVIGVPPTSVDSTFTTSLVTAREVYKACANNPLVDRYLDPIGCADLDTVPAAYAAKTYSPGDRVFVSNAVWSADITSPQAFNATEGPLGTFNSALAHKWRQRSLWLHGNGNATSGSGTRAFLLGTDNLHYRDSGHALIAATVDSLLRAA